MERSKKTREGRKAGKKERRGGRIGGVTRRRGPGKLPAYAEESERGEGNSTDGEVVSVGRISMTNTGRTSRGRRSYLHFIPADKWARV